MLSYFRQKYLVRLHGVIFVASCLSSCELINPDEPIPVYVHCDSIPFRITASSQGSASSSIVDAWAYLDGVMIGTFEMPVQFPVLAEGTHTLTIKPGILVNGIRSTRGPYPYYASYDTTFAFVPGQTVTVTPRTVYLTQTQFKLLEDFEQTGLYFERGANSDTTLNIINDANAFESHSGSIYLDAVHPYFNYRSSPPFSVTLGKQTYAELNYKCDNEFNVGIIAQVGTSDFAEEILTIRPSGSWKKIYVNLTDAIGHQPFATGYRLLLTATKAPNQSVASIYLDNIKVVH